MDQKVIIENAWKEYNRGLLSFIRRKINSPEDAEEILSNIYLKLATQVELSRIPQKLPAWLYRVARNSIIDFYRTKKTSEKLPEDLFHVSTRQFWKPAFPDTDESLARLTKKISGKPVIAVGGLGSDINLPGGTLDTANKSLQNNDFDLIAVGRALLADPEWVNKIQFNQPGSKSSIFLQ